MIIPDPIPNRTLTLTLTHTNAHTHTPDSRFEKLAVEVVVDRVVDGGLVLEEVIPPTAQCLGKELVFHVIDDVLHEVHACNPHKTAQKANGERKGEKGNELLQSSGQRQLVVKGHIAVGREV